MTSPDNISQYLSSFFPITLGEMENYRLMNRTDTKYLFPSHLIPRVLEGLDGNYRILEIKGVRVFSYNTVYFDTNDFLFFRQHVTGRLERSKVRIRKYDITGASFLEVKRKTNKNRTVKWRIERDLPADNVFDQDAMKFINKHFGSNHLNLSPVVTNDFNRITFTGINSPERVTVDFNLSFSGNKSTSFRLPYLAVIEIKRDSLADSSPLVAVLKQNRIYPSGFSKYCIGAAAVSQPPKKAILKPRLLYLKKIENEYNRNCSAC
jgi:hypothetical protein